MTQIAATDSALVRLLESCEFPGVSIMSAPHEWGFGIRSKADRGHAGNPDRLPRGRSTGFGAHLIEPRWKMGRLCLHRLERLRSKGAATRRGRRVRPHAPGRGGAPQRGSDRGKRKPAAHSDVEGLAVETDSALDIANLWIGSIAIVVELPLPLLESDACYGPLDDFLRVRGDIALPDPAADIGLAVDLPQ